MAENRYTSRNPWYRMPRSLVSIAVDGPAAPVFRTSPEEPWRVLRTKWRVAGMVTGPIEGGGRASGYFTSATGLTIYRGDAWPEGYRGDAFIADCGSNLIHRKELVADGVSLRAQRPADEQGTEFATCSDVWFRPVQFANAPDGTLYVIDMYREIIEHPWSLPPGIKKHLDLNSGNDRGRIYRIAPEGLERRPQPRLSMTETEEVVKLLGHENAWHRETAARLLYARQDRSRSLPALRRFLEETKSGLGRMHALYALQGQGGLEAAHLIRALSDEDDRVREHAVRLAEPFIGGGDAGAEALRAALVRMADDPSGLVRYQLAFTLGEFRHPARVQAMAELVRRDGDDPWIRAAVLSSLADGAFELFEMVSDRYRTEAGGMKADEGDYAFLRELVEMLGARNDTEEVEAVMSFVEKAEPGAAFALVHALGQGLQRARASLATERLAWVLARAGELAVDRSQGEAIRVQAIELLGLQGFAATGERLLALVRQDEVSGVQLAVLRTLGSYSDPEVGRALIAAWPGLSPRLREEAVRVLLGRPDRAMKLLEAVEQGAVRKTDLSSVQLDFLMNHREAQVRSEAIRLLAGPPPMSAEELMEKYRPALALAGNADRGRTIFVERCASCHRLAGEGHLLGPDLTSVRGSGKEKLLASLLDPGREVLPQYLAFEVETKDEESLLGLVIEETASNITLRQAYGQETVIPRDRVLSLRGQGKSIMPEGLEAGLDPQAMADLLEFVGTAGP